MNFEEAVEKFVESPCRLTTGVPSLSKRWNIDLDTLYAAKASAKDILKNKEQFGTEYNPRDVALQHNYENPLTPEECFKKEDGRLKSKWGSEGNWKYSYDYTQNTDSQINFEEILNKVFKSDEKVVPIVYNSPTNGYCANAYISDTHIGMDVSHATYSNFFDKKVYRNRMDCIIMDLAVKAQQFGTFDTINIDYLGDIFDGQDGYTVKRTHKLPQNMSNSECFEVGLYTNKVFFERLFTSGIANNYKVHFVRESNHGGDMDLYLFQALKLWINTKFPQVEVVIFFKPIDHYIIGNHTFIEFHGKDNVDMKNGWPLTITPAIEAYIDQYIKEYRLYEYFVHVISGDLHQDATTNSKLFRYRKIPALAGSSKWIMSNYGLTAPGVGVDIYKLNKKNVIQDVIEF